MPEINLPATTSTPATTANDALKDAIDKSLQDKMESTQLMMNYQDKSSAIDNIAAIMSSTHRHNQTISENLARS